MAINRIFGAVGTTLGGGSLNNIGHVYISDGDLAVVRDNSENVVSFYRYRGSSSAVQDLPHVVTPVDTVGEGRWHLISPSYFVENLIVDVGKKVIVNEIISNDNDLILGYNNGSIGIRIGSDDLYVEKTLTTSKQIVSTYNGIGAPISVVDTTMCPNLNVEFVGGQRVGNISLLDGTGNPYTVLPKVSDSTVVVPVDPEDLVTKEYVDMFIAPSNHSNLTGLDNDDHVQYIRTDGTRSLTGIQSYATTVTLTSDRQLTHKFYVDSQISTVTSSLNNYVKKDGTTVISSLLSYTPGLVPVNDDHLTNKIYVDGHIRKDGTTIIPSLLSYVVGLTPTNTNHLVNKGYVDSQISMLPGQGDFVNVSGDIMTGRLLYVGSESLNNVSYVVNGADVDNIIIPLYEYSGTVNEVYTSISGSTVTSTIVRKGHPVSNHNYMLSDVSSSVYSLVPYGYLYRSLGGLIDGGYQGKVVGIESITSSGTGYPNTDVVIIDDGNPLNTEKLTVRYTANSGSIVSVEVLYSGIGYSENVDYVVPGGTGGTIRLYVYTGASHSNLNDLSNDDHIQYILADGTRGFTGVVNGVSPLLNANSTELVTAEWVKLTISNVVGGNVSHSDLLNLSNDDHIQYILTDGTRGFTGVVNGVSPLSTAISTELVTAEWVISTISTELSSGVSHSNLNDLSNDDHIQYILADGTRGFTGVVSGITPTNNNHLATKEYVDNIVILTDIVTSENYKLQMNNGILEAVVVP